MVLQMVLAVAFAAAPAQPVQWEQVAASTASLRTGGAQLVSSDALTLGDGTLALVTYWQSNGSGDRRDIYRCVDRVDGAFSPISQSCWKVLAPRTRH